MFLKFLYSKTTLPQYPRYHSNHKPTTSNNFNKIHNGATQLEAKVTLDVFVIDTNMAHISSQCGLPGREKTRMSPLGPKKSLGWKFWGAWKFDPKSPFGWLLESFRKTCWLVGFTDFYWYFPGIFESERTRSGVHSGRTGAALPSTINKCPYIVVHYKNDYIVNYSLWKMGCVFFTWLAHHRPTSSPTDLCALPLSNASRSSWNSGRGKKNWLLPALESLVSSQRACSCPELFGWWFRLQFVVDISY